MSVLNSSSKWDGRRRCGCFCSLRSRAGQPIIEQVDAKIGTLAEIDTLGKSKSLSLIYDQKNDPTTEVSSLIDNFNICLSLLLQHQDTLCSHHTADPMEEETQSIYRIN